MERHRANIVLNVAIVLLITAAFLYVVSGGCQPDPAAPIEEKNEGKIFSGSVGTIDSSAPRSHTCPANVAISGQENGISPGNPMPMPTDDPAEVTPLSEAQPAQPALPTLEGGSTRSVTEEVEEPLPYGGNPMDGYAEIDFYFTRVGLLQPVRRTIGGLPYLHIPNVVDLLLEGPTEEEMARGYKTYIPEGTFWATISESYDGKWCRVYLSDDFCSLSGRPKEASIAIGQIRQTLLAAKPSLVCVEVAIYYFDRSPGYWEDNIYKALGLKETRVDYLSYPSCQVNTTVNPTIELMVEKVK